MIIITVQNYSELSIKAADSVASEIVNNGRTVLGMATGSTPEGMYAELVKRFKSGMIDFRDVVSFNLDEYLSLPPDHKQSYHYYMKNKFLKHINIRTENVNLLSGSARNPELECSSYDAKIKDAGGIDLQVLGIGSNGHIGFNEPADTLSVNTHLVELSPDTVQDNSRFFGTAEQIPERAITMGMGSIMSAKKIVLLASGTGKARAIKNMSGGKVTTKVPASLLQLHRDVTVIVDHAAASLL